MSYLKPKPKIDLSCLDGMIVPAIRPTVHHARGPEIGFRPKRKPDLSCLDEMSPPVTKRAPYVPGPAPGTARVKQGRTRVSKEKDRIAHAKKQSLRAKPKHTPSHAEIEAEIAKIRRVKDVLRALGREQPDDHDLSQPSTVKDETLS